MSQRDRHAESGAVAVSRPVEATSIALRTSRDSVAPAPLIWEERFRALSPAIQERLLNSAREQGFLLAQQIPSSDAPQGDAFQNLLQRIFAASDLTPAPFVDPIEAFDVELDGPQRDAVARALQAPDLLLIQGLPGTGKSRIIAEIIRQASSRAIRVLFLAPSSATIDVALNQISGADCVGVRTLSRQERADSLPPAIGALTWQSREQCWRSEWLANATEREQSVEKERSRILEAMANWRRFEEIAAERTRVESERAIWLARRESTETETRTESSTSGFENAFAEQLRRAEQSRENRLAAIEAELVETQKQRNELQRELELIHERLESLRPLEDASHSSRFWSMNFWKARLNKALPEQLAESEIELTKVDEAIKKLAERDDSLHLQRTQADSDWLAEKDRLIAEEIRRRQIQIDEHLANLEDLDSKFQASFQILCDSLASVVPIPASSKPSDISAARISADQLVSRWAQEHEQARRWREFVENDSDSISRHCRETVQFVAGPLSSQTTDSWFAGPPGNQKFDLLIVDEAHLISENELVATTKRAKRWVLVGEPAQPVPAMTRSRPVIAKSAPRKNLPAAPSLFTRLWDELHHETWTLEAERLCCRLHPVSAADRRLLEKETVEDRADIELRILNRPSGDSLLAEVLFPSKMCIAEAKEYLFRELGEIPCLSRIRSARWTTAEKCLIFRLNSIPTTALPPCSRNLGPGITIHTHDLSPCLTHSEVALVFDEDQGWDAAHARSWVTQHLLMRDSGRTCRLEKSYRQLSALAAWLNEAAFTGCRYQVEHRLDGAIQFEPVPRRSPAGGQRRGGAGFEIDLGDASQRELLPAELARQLPSRGCVNLPEAQAIAEFVQRLSRSSPAIVSAIYPAQATLLRILCPAGTHVALPDQLAQMECDTLLLSLTRSHVSRAVTYGESPSSVVQLFTRPRTRLVVFCDPGTLARRAQWEGAVDHLDEIAGERERCWINALLRFSPLRTPNHARVPEGVKA